MLLMYLSKLYSNNNSVDSTFISLFESQKGRSPMTMGIPSQTVNLLKFGNSPNRLSLSQLFDEFLQAHRDGQISATSIDQYNARLVVNGKPYLLFHASPSDRYEIHFKKGGYNYQLHAMRYHGSAYIHNVGTSGGSILDPSRCLHNSPMSPTSSLAWLELMEGIIRDNHLFG